jgi:glycosyltransferase involved in cell wall biosynthesis
MSPNPYRFVGRPAIGDHFVDRAPLVRKVTEVWQEPGRPGNLSVIGHLRAGKTSLVWHALSLMDRTDIAVLQINVVIHASALDLFRAIAGQLADKVDGLDEAAGAVRAARDWYDLSNAVTALFKEVADRGRYVLLVLDEFDRAPFVLADLSAFQLLRSLASEPEYPVGLITISRRAVIDIETDAAGGSRLDGVLGARCYVGTFTAREAAELIGRARPVVDLSGAADEITGRVGRHPYLLPALCARIVERYLETGTVAVAAAYELQRADFAEYFDRLLRDIDADSDGRGSATLIKIARGADPASYPLEVQKLVSTGVVERTAGALALFSAEFGRYLLARLPAMYTGKPDRGVALVVATEWNSRHGGLSTFNRQLCMGLAELQIRVFCMVLDATDEEATAAATAGVTLLRREPVVGAPDEHRLFRRPDLPDGVTPTLVIGHGRVTGPAALVQGEDYFPRSTKLHFIHMAPDEIEFLKLDRDDDVAETAEIRTRIELQLGRSADRVVAVGPRLYGRFVGYLSGNDDREPLQFNPGFDLPDPRPRRVPQGTPLTVLTLGRMEDAHLKGLDIAARACGRVAGWRHDQRLRPIELVVRGIPAGSGETVHARVIEWAANTELTVVPRTYTPDAERLTEDLQRSSIFLMPSRAEGFGLVGLEAIVAGTPVLISEKSGLGELLIGLLGAERAAPWVVPMVGDTGKDIETWARAIDRVLLDSKVAFAGAEELRIDLAKRLTRAGAAERLLAQIAPD